MSEALLTVARPRGRHVRIELEETPIFAEVLAAHRVASAAPDAGVLVLRRPTRNRRWWWFR